MATADPARVARTLLRSRRYGALSTLSVEMDGWPFGSLAPYVTTHEGTPVVLLSRLAEHTRNLLADPRASLMAREPSGGGDAQAVGRVTVLARAARTSVDAAFRARFVRHLPEAEGHLGLGDFDFYRLEVERVRYIGGFGAIHWIGRADFLLQIPDDTLAAAEAAALEHVNAAHADALRALCRLHHAIACTEPRLLGCDPEGLDVDAGAEHGHRLLRIPFPAPVFTPEELRATLARMARAAR